jgi:predicted nucleic acid-binding protein
VVTIYLDSSALVKLVHEEPESDALRAWLRSRSEVRATSALTRVELGRAVRRARVATLDDARSLLDRVDELPVDRDVLDRAAALPVEARSLDAIHLASALGVGDLLSDLVTYDRRMAVAADALGLPVSAPG